MEISWAIKLRHAANTKISFLINFKALFKCVIDIFYIKKPFGVSFDQALKKEKICILNIKYQLVFSILIIENVFHTYSVTIRSLPIPSR